MRCPKCNESIKEWVKACDCGYKINFKKVPPPPKRLGLINDYEGILTGEHVNKLTIEIKNFFEKTGIEIVITIINNTIPLIPENYAFYLYNKWKLGKNKKEGFLILVAMKERRIETEIGFGLEKYISEEYTGKLLDQHIVPYFKESKYSEGLYTGVTDLIKEISDKVPAI